MTWNTTRTLINIFFVIIAIAVFSLLIWGFESLPVKEWSAEASAFAKRNGPFGVVAFSFVYIVATLCLFPCALLTIAAGMMYGAWGIPLVIFSATTGAAIAFVLARYFALAKVNALFEKRAFTRALKKAIQNEGLKFMILLRISPLIPFNLNNYLMGAAPVTFAAYIFATFLGTIPGTLLYIYVGTFGRGPSQQQDFKWLLFAFGFVGTIVLGKLAVQRTKSILSSQPV